MQPTTMSGSIGQKRNIAEISSDFPLLPKDVLPRIVQFSPDHLCLRLVSLDWNQGVIDAHCDLEFECLMCTCTSSLSQFHMKRLLLPWISKWDFKIESTSSLSLLSDMMYHKNSRGPQVLRMSSSFGTRAIVPIKSCKLEIGEANSSDAEHVFSSSQMQPLKKLMVCVIEPPGKLFSVEGRKKLAAALTKLEQMGSLEMTNFKFDYDGSAGSHDFQRLIRSFPNLRHCMAMRCALNDEAISVFASSSSVSNLETLYLTHCAALTSAGIHNCIASSPYLTNLNTLVLKGSRVGDAAMVSLCQSPFLTRLLVLAMSTCNLTDASIDAMVTSANMKSLQHLSIDRNLISAAGLVSLLLAASTRNSSLSKLMGLFADNIGVSGPQFSEEVANLFSPLVGGVELPQRRRNLRLKIGDRHQFNELSVSSLARIPLMACVSHLEISCSTETAASLLFIPSSRFTSLKVLFILAPKITWQTVADVANSSTSKQVHTLHLGANVGAASFEQHLDDRCCKALANSASGCLEQLKILKLERPNLSVSVGLIAILSSPNLPSLTHLNCDVTSNGPTVAEPMTEAEAAERIIELLSTTARRMQYVKLPNTAFAATVRDLVKQQLPSMSIE